jgi:hypothetical protein
MTEEENAAAIEDHGHRGPSGGWGSAQASASILLQEHVMLRGSSILLHQNKTHGFALRQLFVGETCAPAHHRGLRERHQGDRVGNHLEAHRRRFFRTAYGRGLAALKRP